MTKTRQLLSWSLLVFLTVTPMTSGFVYLVQLRDQTEIERDTRQMAVALAQQQASRLPVLQEKRALLEDAAQDNAATWLAQTAETAALDLQETARKIAEASGLSISRIDPAPPTPQDSRLDLSLSASGDIAALQLALYQLETSIPKMTVTDMRLRQGRGDMLDISITLSAEYTLRD